MAAAMTSSRFLHGINRGPLFTILRLFTITDGQQTQAGQLLALQCLLSSIELLPRVPYCGTTSIISHVKRVKSIHVKRMIWHKGSTYYQVFILII